MQGLDIAAPPTPPQQFSDYATAAIRFINREVSKARILGHSSGLRNLEVDAPAPLCLWEELTAAFPTRSAVQALAGVRNTQRNQPVVDYEEVKCTETGQAEAKRTTRSLVIYLGDLFFYEFFQLEGHKLGCGGPAKEFNTQDSICVYRLQLDHITTRCVSDTFLLETLRAKIGLIHIQHQRADPNNPGAFLPLPTISFPVMQPKYVDRELPAIRKQSIIDSALTIPRWMNAEGLLQYGLHPNFT